MTRASDPSYFPIDYRDSRQRFRATVAEISAPVQIEAWSVPGRTDPDLFVDCAYWPALENPDFFLVLTSGLHGSETYAGSAVQQMFLEEFLPRMNRTRVGVFMAHAMNPYGFKHHSRTTEAGVNLNRNFSVSEDLYQTRNEASAHFHRRFYSRQPVTSMQSRLFEHLNHRGGRVFFDDLPFDQIIKSLSLGQFDRPEDLEFGGHELEPQSRQLVDRMRELMPGYREILALDLHTGLGDRNRLHLLTSGHPGDLHPELFARLFDPEADRSLYTYTPASTEGFYQVLGSLNSVFRELARSDQKVCAITMEFGTLGHSLEAQLEGLNNVIVNHQGRHYGFATPELARQSQAASFARSYPQSDEWRSAVIQASRGLFSSALKRCGALKSAG